LRQVQIAPFGETARAHGPLPKGLNSQKSLGAKTKPSGVPKAFARVAILFGSMFRIHANALILPHTRETTTHHHMNIMTYHLSIDYSLPFE